MTAQTDDRIVEALVEAILFLELSDDDTVDPDAAVTALEGIAGHLRRLTPAQKGELVASIRRLAEAQPATAEGQRRKTTISGIPENLGLSEA
jgi:hypothetical protein